VALVDSFGRPVTSGDGSVIQTPNSTSLPVDDYDDFDDDEDYGDASYLAAPDKKPDGTPLSLLPASTAIKQGTASVTTDEVTDSATNPIEDGEGTVSSETATSTDSNLSSNLTGIIPNPMEQFASFSPLWTLAVLTPEQFNDPQLYRTNDLSFGGDFEVDWDAGEIMGEASIVFSSGGRGDEYRTTTFNGSPEYFIDNFKMRTIVSPNAKSGNTNAISFEFDVLEPYSMGLFLQSLQNAALKARHVNYLSAPFLLRLDVKGWAETGEIIESIKPKYFVLKFNKASFNVNEGGSKYTVSAVPYNHQGFADSVNTLFNDVSITSEKGTVEEILVSGEKSLCRFLNDNEERLVKQGKIGVPDVYEVQFANTSSDFIRTAEPEENTDATTTPNETTPGEQTIKGANSGGETALEFGTNNISSANFGFDASSGGNYLFVKEGDVYDPDTGIVQRDKVTIDTVNRAFMFSQQQSLTDIITQVILSSSFAKDVIDSSKLGPDGMVTWFRIDVQIELLDYDSITGDFARKIIYRVVPYKVHHSIFSNPTSAPVGLANMAKKAAKHYQYIYTGQNSDILKFDIQINNLFYVGVNPSSESNTSAIINPDQNGAAVNDVRSVKTGSGISGDETQTANTGRTRPKRDPSLLAKRVSGGSGTKDVEQVVAESFHNAFINGSSADLVSVKLQIMGDPYWLVDSGIANYFSPASAENELITEDGTMNFESGEVYIYLTFKTPADVNETTGLYDFSNEQEESPFSGLYRVTTCENMFEGGMWIQELSCVRYQRQPNDFDGKQLTTQTDGVFASEVGDVLPVKTSPLEEYTNIIAERYGISEDSEQARLLAEQEAEFFEDEEVIEEAATPTASPPLYTGTVTGPEEGEAETVFNEYSMEEEETGRVWDDNLGDYI